MNTKKTVLIELTEEEAHLMLAAVYMRRDVLKRTQPKDFQKYHDLMRKIEDQGVRL